MKEMRARLVVFMTQGASILLPDLVLWAFQLNEGDLLTVAREESDSFRCRFRSYQAALRTMADWGNAVQWRFIEEMLRLPMAAVGPFGSLLLPDEAATLWTALGNPLLLCIEAEPVERWFTLEPSTQRRTSTGIFLEARYELPVENGSRVSLPEDVLWVLGLEEGDLLACKTSLGDADFEPLTQIEPLRGRTLVTMGAGGVLPLPEPLLRGLRPGWRMRLTVTFSPEPAFRLSYSVD